MPRESVNFANVRLRLEIAQRIAYGFICFVLLSKIPIPGTGAAVSGAEETIIDPLELTYTRIEIIIINLSSVHVNRQRFYLIFDGGKTHTHTHSYNITCRVYIYVFLHTYTWCLSIYRHFWLMFSQIGVRRWPWLARKGSIPADTGTAATTAAAFLQ